MQTAATTFGEPESRHSHRKRVAKIYVVVIFGIILAADALLFRFVFSEHNPLELLVGLLIGQIASTPFLIIAICRRLYWARYVLIALLFIVMAFFSLVAVYMNSRQEYRDPGHLISIGLAMALLVVANTWLIRSKRIQHLARMGQSGGI